MFGNIPKMSKVVPLLKSKYMFNSAVEVSSQKNIDSSIFILQRVARKLVISKYLVQWSPIQGIKVTVFGRFRIYHRVRK